VLKISDLTIIKNGQRILQDISCQLPVGEIVALLGPSGSGKTTLLRCLARLEETPKDKIFFKDHEIHTLSPTQIGMVFQNFNLFPHMTVMENLCFSPKKLHQRPHGHIEEKAKQLLENFGLSDKEGVYPSQLSGGQRQRIAIARTLMLDPDIILFDEPTSALDPEMVTDVAQIIQGLKHQNRLIIMATHELKICHLIADHVLFLDGGKIVDDLEKKAFFSAPKSQRAKVFIEKMTGV
jgi:polar amino acid transport system ATP-binding protein